MKTLIFKKMGVIAIVGCIALAMSACSTTKPAPWSKPSPWSQKRADEVAYSEPVSEEPVAVMAVEPMAVEPVEVEAMAVEPEAVAMMEEPLPETYGEPMNSAEQPMSPEEEIMSAPSGNYTIQVIATASRARVDAFSNKHNLDDMSQVRTERDGKVWYVLLAGNYSSYSDAKADLAVVGDRVSTEPWVRKIKSLQKIVAPQ